MINLNNLNVSSTTAINYTMFKNNNQTFSLIRITGAINITGPLYFSLFSISSGTTYNCIDIELGSVNLTSTSQIIFLQDIVSSPITINNLQIDSLFDPNSEGCF